MAQKVTQIVTLKAYDISNSEAYLLSTSSVHPQSRPEAARTASPTPWQRHHKSNECNTFNRQDASNTRNRGKQTVGGRVSAFGEERESLTTGRNPKFDGQDLKI